MLSVLHTTPCGIAVPTQGLICFEGDLHFFPGVFNYQAATDTKDNTVSFQVLLSRKAGFPLVA